MENLDRDQIAQEATDKLILQEDLQRLEQMLKDNEIEWDFNEVKYKVKALDYPKQQLLREAMLKRHTELLKDSKFLFRKQVIILLKAKGVDIEAMTNEQLQINEQIKDLQLKLAEFGDVPNNDDPMIVNLRGQIYQLKQDINNISEEKIEYLSYTIESELVYLNTSFSTYLALEKFQEDKWVKAFDSYELFMNAKEQIKMQATNYFSMVIYKINKDNEQ